MNILSPNAVLSSIVLLVPTDNRDTSTTRHAQEIATEHNGVNFSRVAGETLGAPCISHVLEISENWDHQKNARFRELVRRECFDELSSAEMAELNSLSALRRTQKHPRTATEILRARRHAMILKDLEKVVRSYVEFFET